MADKEISELTLKATPVGTDEIELQQTGGGSTRKTTLQAVWDQISTSSVDINGGTIDGTPIGINSASSASFTSLAASGQSTLQSQIDIGGNASGPASGRGQIGAGSTNGLQLLGNGSTYDAHLGSRTGAIALGVVANTQNLAALGNLSFTNGNGIDLTAAGGNVFNYYESDTWSPVIADAASGGNTSSTSPTGSFVRIGDLCIAWFSAFNIDDTGLTGGNDFYIRGLPFASVSDSSRMHGVVNGDLWSLGGSNSLATCAVDNSSTVGRIYEGAASGFSAMSVSDLTGTNQEDLYCTFIYRVA